MTNRTVRVGVIGVGNCAASFWELAAICRAERATKGIMTPNIGGYLTDSVEVVCAFDIDSRKVGQRLSRAIRAVPNCSGSLGHVGEIELNPIVERGPTLDGIAAHRQHGESPFVITESEMAPVDVVAHLRECEADVLVCYLPVGSEQAVRWYAEAALRARVAFVNCVPVFISEDDVLVQEFKRSGVPLVGDDVRSQVGATIVHQRLVELITERGAEVVSSMQLNVGGNADFYNMRDESRLESKRVSKTRAVEAYCLHGDPRLHIGPSDFVEHLGDRKVAYIEIEARGAAGVPIRLEVKLSVEDSPNSASIVMDLVRYAAVLKDLRRGGIADAVSSYYMKSPRTRIGDSDARAALAELSMGS